MNSVMMAGMTTAPLRTAVVRSVERGGVVVGRGRATGAGSVALTGTASGSSSFAAGFGLASGSGSFALTGTASGLNSFAAGLGVASNSNSIALGLGSVASGLGGIALGAGSTNPVTASGQAGIVMGQSCTAGGGGSLAIGRECRAYSQWSIVLGNFGIANQHGQFVHSSDYIAAAGDSQFSNFVLRGTTVSTTPVILSLSVSAGVKLGITSGRCCFYTVKIVGIKNGGSIVSNFLRKVCIKNIGGVTSLVGSVETIATDEANGTSISITANDSTDSLDIQVTGIDGETWRWVAVVNGAEVVHA